MENILSNTGTVAFVLYGLFIGITIVALYVGIRSILKGAIPADKLDKMVELFKYAIVTVAIATTTMIITNLFEEREQDIKELEYFDKYVQDVKKADNLLERRQLSRYLSIVAPSGAMKNSWQCYYDTVAKEYDAYLEAKAAQVQSQRQDTVVPPSTPQQLRNEQIINAAESPLVSEVSTKELPSTNFSVMVNPDPARAAQLEQQGFRLLLQDDYSGAAAAFTQSENARNGFRSSYELATLLRGKAAAMASDTETRKKVLREIRDKYDAYALPEVKQWLMRQTES